SPSTAASSTSTTTRSPPRSPTASRRRSSSWRSASVSRSPGSSPTGAGRSTAEASVGLEGWLVVEGAGVDGPGGVGAEDRGWGLRGAVGAEGCDGGVDDRSPLPARVVRAPLYGRWTGPAVTEVRHAAAGSRCYLARQGRAC